MPKQPSLRDLAAIMARDGSLTFGGGAPTTVALESTLVRKHGWLEFPRFRLAYALSRLTPGTNMLAFCTALGYQLRGMSGAVVALISASLPCSVVALAIMILLETWQTNPVVALGVQGASAITIGFVAASCWPLIRPHMRKQSWPRTLMLVASAVLLDVWGVPPLRVLLGAAVVGALWREPA